MARAARPAGLALAICLAVAPAAEAQSREFSQTYDLDAGASLTLISSRGSVRLTPWDRDQVEVRARIEAPSAWDSSVVILFIIEALISAVETATWQETKDRMKTLEALFDQTRMFRKFT